MKILILGAGGTGGYFGMRWIKAGGDVTFLVRPGRQAQLQRDGLIVETPQERLTQAVTTMTAETLDGDFDLVVLSPKAYDLESAIEAVKKVKGSPIILPLLNGLDHINRLDAAFGADRVMGGTVHIGATLTPEGIVKQLTPLHRLFIGIRAESQQNVPIALQALSEKCPYEFYVSDNILQTLWDKWTFLATLAATTTLLQASVGEILATPWGEEIMRETYASCCEVASASGFPIQEPVRQQALGVLLEQGSAFTSSMLRDLRANLRTEHEHILGAMVRRAESLGKACHTVKAAYTALVVTRK